MDIHGEAKDTHGLSAKYEMPSMLFSWLPPADAPTEGNHRKLYESRRKLYEKHRNNIGTYKNIQFFLSFLIIIN